MGDLSQIAKALGELTELASNPWFWIVLPTAAFALSLRYNAILINKLSAVEERLVAQIAKQLEREHQINDAARARRDEEERRERQLRDTIGYEIDRLAAGKGGK